MKKSEMMPESFVSKDFVYAVVGVSSSVSKYGSRIFRSLIDRGYTAYGVNPKSPTIHGRPTYKSLFSLPEKPDVVILVVPPEVSLKILEDVKKLGIKKVWFQPGSSSQGTDKYCRKYGISFVKDNCFITDELKVELLL
ncbi:CoA-binding protein [Candidatus Micrarchaeota archaeon]|nr:CoA-binding protein [Candidatus Micrarchaeota archaeon]